MAAFQHKYLLYCTKCDYEEDDSSPACRNECPKCQEADRLRWVRYLPEDNPAEVRAVMETFRAARNDELGAVKEAVCQA